MKNSDIKWKEVNKRIGLMHSNSYIKVLDSVTKEIYCDRDTLLCALLEYCGFFSSKIPFFEMIDPKLATKKHLSVFHTYDYLNALQNCVGEEDNEKYDLKDVSNNQDLWKYCQYTAGASLHAADLLATHDYSITINWGGGRHHASPSSASGFCFVNDIVLAILHLGQHYDKILYLDIDIHHGDGVQTAFYDDPNVLTVSFHRFVPGVFYPATLNGSLDYKGAKQGFGYNWNIPLPAHCNDSDFFDIFQRVLKGIKSVFQPQVIVLCVGTDGLHRDPLVSQTDPGWRLTPHGIQRVVQFTAKNSQKLLLLGGGGYEPSHSAFTLFLCTAIICDVVHTGFIDLFLPLDIPRDFLYWNRFYPNTLIKQSNSYEPQYCFSWREQELYQSILQQAKKSIDLATSYVQCKENQTQKRDYITLDQQEKNQYDWEKDCFKLSKRRKRIRK